MFFFTGAHSLAFRVTWSPVCFAPNLFHCHPRISRGEQCGRRHNRPGNTFFAWKATGDESKSSSQFLRGQKRKTHTENAKATFIGDLPRIPCVRVCVCGGEGGGNRNRNRFTSLVEGEQQNNGAVTGAGRRSAT